ncbi:MAG: hypothetical protein QM820_20855 [Minicystis sp.]
MARYDNPYLPPQSAGVDYSSGDAAPDSGEVPAPIVDLLRQTRPWVMFLAILGFIGTGLMALVGLGMLGMGKMGNLPAGVGFVYIVLAVIYLFPAVRLLRYASSIGLLLRDPRMERLRVAIESQKSFWKLVGIMTAIIVALYPIAIVIGVFVAVAAKR